MNSEPFSSQSSSNFAASLKVVADSITTIFGAAVMVLFFFGVALTIVVSRDILYQIIHLAYWLMSLMVAIIVGLVALRIFMPDGLSGPIKPETNNVKFKNSKSS